jgi:hypothetical protein
MDADGDISRTSAIRSGLGMCVDYNDTAPDALSHYDDTDATGFAKILGIEVWDWVRKSVQNN